MKKVILTIICLLTISNVIYSDSIHDSIIIKARSLLGTPYRIGGISPSGFDCSGFINYLYKPHIPKLPRVSRDMAKTGIPVSRDHLIPGDLIFYATGSSRDRVTHVALYIGQNSIIHSISNGPERGVTLSSINASYWKKRYHNSSRILKDTINDNSGSAQNMVFAKGIYNGQLKNGNPSGKGRMLMKNGDSYKGEFVKGLFHGKGKYLWADGKMFSGQFIDGKFSGKGSIIMADGRKISGFWKDGAFVQDRLAVTNVISSDEADIPAEVQDKPEKIDSSADRGIIKAESYMETEDSPWNSYDGVVEGDFSLWFKKDMDAFEEWKKTH